MDTVVYRIHNPDRYPHLIAAVLNLKNGKGKMKIPNKKEYVEAESFRDAFFSKALKNDYWHIMSYMVKEHMPSSAAGIQIIYDDQKKFIQFEFSIPKFFFGNNVCELLPDMRSRWHIAGKMAMYDNAEFWYRIICALPNKIIHDLTQGQVSNVSPYDIQVCRVDIAFNQIFDTMQEAAHYFDSLREVSFPRLVDTKKYQYEGTNMVVPTNKAYSFKVYKKGAEFADIQDPQIRKQWETYYKEKILDLDGNLNLSLKMIPELQAYADRILRYELSCRTKLMYQLYNRLYKKQELKRGTVQVYKDLLHKCGYLMRKENIELLTHAKIEYHGKLGGMVNPRKPAYEDLGNFNVVYFLPHHLIDANVATKYEMKIVTKTSTINKLDKMYKVLNYLNRKYAITNLKELKIVWKKLQKEESMAHTFFLESEEKDASQVELRPVDIDDDIETHTAMGILEKSPVKQKFSLQLFKAIIWKHNELFSVLQFENLPPLKEIVLKAKSYNERISRQGFTVNGKKPSKVNINRIKLIASLLQKHTWDTIRKTGFYDRTTIWRWKNDMDKILGCDISINLMPFSDLRNVARKPQDIYIRHYDEMLAAKNPLALFLQNTPLLLLV